MTEKTIERLSKKWQKEGYESNRTHLGSGVASRENDGRTDQNPVYPRLHLSFVFAGGPVYEPSE